jgi:hypothetical protein
MRRIQPAALGAKYVLWTLFGSSSGWENREFHPGDGMLNLGFMMFPLVFLVMGCCPFLVWLFINRTNLGMIVDAGTKTTDGADAWRQHPDGLDIYSKSGSMARFPGY